MFVELKPVYGKTYKAGQVFFTRDEKSLISNGISWFTYKDDLELKWENNWTHCGVCIGDNTAIEADWNGVSKIALDKYFNSKNTRIVFREPYLLDIMGADKLVEYAYDMSSVGYKYDYKQLIGLGLLKLLKGLIKPNVEDIIKQYFDVPNRYICSELVMALLFKSEFTFDKDFNKTPREVFAHPMFKEWKRMIPL